MAISDFAAEKVAVAKDFRGLSKVNPVEFTLENNGKNFILLCSDSEPDTVTVPHNVLWINTDEDHPDFLVVQRRVDAEKYDDSGYRGTWSVISSVEELFTEDQYYKAESDPILGEVEQFRPQFASTQRLGGVRTTVDRQEETEEDSRQVVGTNDERMSNPRKPRDHTHADIPRTMFAADGEGDEAKHVLISENDPQVGDILVVMGQDEDGNYVGSWVSPAMEFPYIGPVPTSITVVGPSAPVNGSTGHVLRADVEMSDGTILRNVAATWTVDNSEASSVGLNTGVFRANNVEFDTLVKVTARWVHVDSGTVVETEFDITIKGNSGAIALASIAILGAASFPKEGTEQYTVEATYTDGTTRIVTPVTFTSSNAAAGQLVDGLLTPNQDQRGNVQTTLSASYTENAITKETTRNITVTDAAVYPRNITISGPTQLNTGAQQQYTAVITNTDDSTQDYSGAWTVTGSGSVTSDGILTGGPINTPGDKTATLRVEYSANGVTVNDTHQVTIVDNQVWPQSSVINGPASVQSGQTANYEFVVTYSDGSEQVKTPQWAANGQATIAQTGVLTANTVTEDGSSTITATFSERGVNLNATRAVSVTAPGQSDVPPARIGVAKFANRNFTGGVINEEITQEEIDYGVSLTNGQFGAPYEYWDGFEDFAEKVMTTQITVTSTAPSANWSEAVLSDYYVYFMWPAVAGNIEIKNQMGFISTWTGVNHRTPQLGNEEGLPGYDPNLPSVKEVEFDDGSGTRTWKVIKLETTPLPEASPATLTYNFKYV